MPAKGRLRKLFSQSLAVIVRGEEIVVFASIVFVALAIFVQVLLRYFTSLHLFGIEEIALIVVGWFYLIGASYAIHHEIYLRVDLLTIIVKNRLLMKVINLVSLILGILAAGVLCYLTTKYCIWAVGAHVITTAWMVSVNFQLASLAVGGGLIILHMAIQLSKAVGDILHPPSDSERKMGEKPQGGGFYF